MRWDAFTICPSFFSLYTHDLNSIRLSSYQVAWYPDQPTADDARQMAGFFATLGKFYPCTWCAADFQEQLEAKPVQAESRTDLCIWLCEQHNHVNTKLGKPIFECDMKSLDERWRKSSKSECSGSGH
jgi:FAD-linked sulfhydryl oxidase